MKKSILVSLLATAGVAAYFVSKKLKPKDDYEEVMFVEIDDEEDEDKEYGPTVQEIQKMYPELSLNFINNTFEQNDKFNEEYTGNVKVEHHISFQDESDLNIFIDVCKDNKYEVEKDGNSVKVISKFTNEKGSIMSDIFNVANQCLLLNGQYLGYKIEVEK
ncbi:MAG: ribonuclease E inhibitor RraB [Erysipelotrichaceae bacterium]|nr:ribonuclease E inhibitor RraB [Erysipelotrichaceae bacterium]